MAFLLRGGFRYVINNAENWTIRGGAQCPMPIIGFGIAIASGGKQFQRVRECAQSKVDQHPRSRAQAHVFAQRGQECGGGDFYLIGAGSEVFGGIEAVRVGEYHGPKLGRGSKDLNHGAHLRGARAGLHISGNGAGGRRECGRANQKDHNQISKFPGHYHCYLGALTAP